jgi:hypothetical protein
LSETLHVNCHRIGNFILTDTPGFKDNRGCEIEIANAVGITTSIRGAGSVKPIILLDYKEITQNKLT